MPSIKLDDLSFVHIPRTAGTSIGHWLKANRRTSSYQERYDHPLLEHMGASSQSFTVVRNPWDRLLSLYCYSKNFNVTVNGFEVFGISNAQAQQYLNSINNITIWPDFNTWVEGLETFKLPEIYWFDMLTTQSRWAESVDIILRFETLDEDFKRIQDILNCTVPLHKENSSTHDHYKYHYNNKTKDLVYKWFKKDINNWGYEF
jgi:hypothetical protein